MLRLSLALPPLLTFLTVPSLLHGQRSGMGGRVSGGVIDVQVRYANGKPGPRGIHVRLEAAEGGPAGDCETVDGGKCQFNLSSSGVYMVRMSERGFKEVIVRVELIGMSRGYATLELKPIPGEAPPETPKQASGDTVSLLDLSIPENARQEFEKGQSALKEIKLDDGIAHLRKAITLYNAFPQAYALLGTAYLGQKDWKNAEVALRKANELDPKFSDAYLELGGAESDQGIFASRSRTAEGPGTQPGGRWGPLRAGEDVLGVGSLAGCRAPCAQGGCRNAGLGPGACLAR